MPCPSFDDLLRSLADDAANGTVRNHVESCDACRRTVGRLAEVFRHAALFEEFLAGASQKMPSRWARLIAQRVHAAFEAQFAARPTCPSRDELFDWVVGGSECDAAIGTHIGLCVRCQQALAEVSALLGGASQWDVITAPPAPLADEPMPVGLSERIFGTVNAAYEARFAGRRETVAQSKRGLRRRFSRTGSLVAAAASLLLGVGGVVWQMRNGPGVTELPIASRETGLPVVNSPERALAAANVRQPAASTIGETQSASPAMWTRLAHTAVTAGSQLGRRAKPWLAIFRQGIRPPTPDDWSRLAAGLVEQAKRARQAGRIGDEERLLARALAVAKDGGTSAARQVAYGLLLVRNRLDQNRPDAALAAYDELPAIDTAEIGRARQHIAARLARTFHERGRSASAVMLLASLEGDLDAGATRTLADARLAVKAQTTRLVGTGNKALTHKVEQWAQTRLASSIAQVTR